MTAKELCDRLDRLEDGAEHSEGRWIDGGILWIDEHERDVPRTGIIRNGEYWHVVRRGDRDEILQIVGYEEDALRAAQRLIMSEEDDA